MSATDDDAKRLQIAVEAAHQTVAQDRDYFPGVIDVVSRRGATKPPADAETMAETVARLNPRTLVLLDIHLLRGE